MSRTIRLAGCFLLVQLAVAGTPKLSKDLEGQKPGARVDVIIQFANPAEERGAGTVEKGGGWKKEELAAAGGALYSVPVDALKGLANNPNIRYISPDRGVKAALDHAVPTAGAHIAANYGWTGAGIGVAVIDSGVSTSPEDLETSNKPLRARVVYHRSFGVTGTSDKYGHGTHVAGIVGGNGYESGGLLRGMAPGADIVSLRVLNDNGSGSDSAVIAAIDAAISLKAQYNIRVINLSLGRPVFESFTVDPLCKAVEAAWRAGIVVVAAAGNVGRDNSFQNDGYGTITSPGNHPLVITVGAMKTMGTALRADDRIASYSSKGPTLIDHVVKPDLVAPGNRIVSLLANSSSLTTNYPGNSVPTSYYSTKQSTSPYYFRMSGTSMAAPMVSGAAPLLLQKNPLLTPDQVKARLMRSAAKSFPLSSSAANAETGQIYSSEYNVFTMGAGYLDVWAALNDTTPVPAGLSAASPPSVYDAATKQVKMVTGSSVLWGSSLVWGTSVVWGGQAIVRDDSVLRGESVLWGSAVVWGSGGTSGFSVLWGVQSPYAGSVVWGENTEATAVLIRGEQ